MNTKYYTPELEEFHAGFEYEIFEDFDHFPEKTWHKQTYVPHGANPELIGYVSNSLIEQNLVRVKCLDRKDILSLGFKPKVFNGVECYGNDKIFLFMFDYTSVISIDRLSLKKREPSPIFRGTIKNKSELKKLLKQFGI